MRLDSSNYDPMLGWRHGAQMVAFNMQVRPVRMCTILVQVIIESISGHATTPAYSGAMELRGHPRLMGKAANHLRGGTGYL